MIDANGETSTEIKVDIEGEDGKYKLSLIPDKKWLNDKKVMTMTNVVMPI